MSGKPLDAFYRERIFAPLKMDSSGLQVPASAAPRLTTNYDVTPGGLDADPSPRDERLAEAADASGRRSLVSTAADYVRFIRMLFGGGVMDGVRVLKPETVAWLACSDLLPTGVTGEEGGFGAGMRVGLDGRHRRRVGLGKAQRGPSGALIRSGGASSS